MELSSVWFVIIAFLWIGYFFLEGFDFGVGVLTGVLARNERERRVLLNTIGPVWDGNEVWLLTAGGATFAAFPDWYATLFSGFYLPLLLILVCLIIRGVGFEYRAKRPDPRWKRNWEHAVFVCSLIPAFLWGLVFANVVRGVDIGPDKEYAGGLLDLLNPYALLGGVVTLCLFTLHGAVFTALKTLGPIRERARALATWLGLTTAVAALGFLLWTQADHGNVRSLVAMAVAVVALLAALAANRAGREGWSFVGSGVTIAAAVTMLFLTLYPDVMPSSRSADFSLTVENAASSPYTLKIMTWLAVFATPMVLAYQGWTYWVFRRRIGVQHIPDDGTGGGPAGGGSTGGGVPGGGTGVAGVTGAGVLAGTSSRVPSGMPSGASAGAGGASPVDAGEHP